MSIYFSDPRGGRAPAIQAGHRGVRQGQADPRGHRRKEHTPHQGDHPAGEDRLETSNFPFRSKAKCRRSIERRPHMQTQRRHRT